MRMDQAARHELDPGRSLAHAAAVLAEGAARVELEARLDEGEEARAQPGLQWAAEDALEQRVHRVQHVRHAVPL